MTDPRSIVHVRRGRPSTPTPPSRSSPRSSAAGGCRAPSTSTTRRGPTSSAWSPASAGGSSRSTTTRRARASRWPGSPSGSPGVALGLDELGRRRAQTEVRFTKSRLGDARARRGDDPRGRRRRGRDGLGQGDAVVVRAAGRLGATRCRTSPSRSSRLASRRALPAIRSPLRAGSATPSASSSRGSIPEEGATLDADARALDRVPRWLGLGRRAGRRRATSDAPARAAVHTRGCSSTTSTRTTSALGPVARTSRRRGTTACAPTRPQDLEGNSWTFAQAGPSDARDAQVRRCVAKKTSALGSRLGARGARSRLFLPCMSRWLTTEWWQEDPTGFGGGPVHWMSRRIFILWVGCRGSRSAASSAQATDRQAARGQSVASGGSKDVPADCHSPEQPTRRSTTEAERPTPPSGGAGVLTCGRRSHPRDPGDVGLARCRVGPVSGWPGVGLALSGWPGVGLARCDSREGC